ncbi:MAG: effector protein, partial [Acidimicrobiia bacterium]|nr:effector protein [Acidimicrobiia bacterium]
MYEHLLAPGRIGTLEVRNRIVMAPMGVEIVDADGHAREPLIAYYEERARGGVGLIITEVCAMAYPRGANSAHQLGLSSDAFIADLAALTDRVHTHGAAIAAQLVHHGKISRLDTKEGRPVLVPSVPSWPGSMDMINDLSAEELGLMGAAVGNTAPQYQVASADDLARTVDEFAEATRRARDAGFDGVEIHAAHGYLLSGF